MTSSVTAVASGWVHSFGLKSDTCFYAWGWNSSGQLGNGESGDSRDRPVQVGSECGWGTSAAAGVRADCAAAIGMAIGWERDTRERGVASPSFKKQRAQWLLRPLCSPRNAHIGSTC
jgi:hypothetical protein